MVFDEGVGAFDFSVLSFDFSLVTIGFFAEWVLNLKEYSTRQLAPYPCPERT